MTEKNENALQEVQKKVVITPEDVSGAAEFWTHFEVPMPKELKDAFETFKNNPSVETQDAVKLQICKAIGYTDHEAFNDEMFKEIVAECRDTVYDMEFDQNLEKTLGTEPAAEPTKKE